MTCTGWEGEAGLSVVSRDDDELENLACWLEREKVGVTGDGRAKSDEDEAELKVKNS